MNSNGGKAMRYFISDCIDSNKNRTNDYVLFAVISVSQLTFLSFVLMQNENHTVIGKACSIITVISSIVCGADSVQ